MTMTSDQKTSADSMAEANRSRAEFSGHGNAIGAAGKRQSSYDPDNAANLREPGQFVAISPGPEGFKSFDIAVEWDNVKTKNSGLIGKLIKKAVRSGVDLDLGCLYELADGTRGAVQAFGEKMGSFDSPPYVSLSGDERTGDAEGKDEVITVNGMRWKDLKKIIVYIYIYGGAAKWSEINPRVVVDVPGEEDLYVTLGAHDDALCVCAVAALENVRGGIKLTNLTEYFPGHQEMDRAFGFGLNWGDGRK